MGELPTYSDNGVDTTEGTRRQRPTRRKVGMAVAVSLVVIVILVLHLTGVVGSGSM